MTKKYIQYVLPTEFTAILEGDKQFIVQDLKDGYTGGDSNYCPVVEDEITIVEFIGDSVYSIISVNNKVCTGRKIEAKVVYAEMYPVGFGVCLPILGIKTISFIDRSITGG